MLELYYYPRVLRRLRSGGLGGEMDRIATYLFKHGYKRGSAKVYLRRLGRFSSVAMFARLRKGAPQSGIVNKGRSGSARRASCGAR
jgi:integrase/recombinase XerD